MGGKGNFQGMKAPPVARYRESIGENNRKAAMRGAKPSKRLDKEHSLFVNTTYSAGFCVAVLGTIGICFAFYWFVSGVITQTTDSF